MSKRSVPSFPVEEQHDAKRQKLEPLHSGPVDQESRVERNVDNNIADTDVVENEIRFEPSPIEGTEKAGKVKQKTDKQKKPEAVGGFDKDWIPEEAKDGLKPPVEAEPHWGIVPRPTNYRPTEPQPSARNSNAAVVPPLWEDRKGGVRLKRPSRYIKGYDQAHHMYLRLMDLRPHSATNPKPRRKPIHYWYKHGMIIDWRNSGAVNDTNKALQGAIRTNSNKESAWQANERNALARICGENPDAAIWDISVQFNDEVYPLTKGDTEAGRYPSGRFIESVVHEYRAYKSSYDKGEAPSEETEKDMRLEQLYKEWRGEQIDAKEAEKKAKKAAKEAEKAEKKAKMEEGEKNTYARTNGTPEKSTAKVSDTAGVTKPWRKGQTKGFTKEQEAIMEANAAATVRGREELDAAAAAIKASEEAAKAIFESTGLQPAESGILTTDQPRLYDKDRGILELAGGYSAEDARPSSPLSLSARDPIASPSYKDETTAVDPEDQVRVAQTSESNKEATVTSSPPVATDSASGFIPDAQTNTLSESTAVQAHTTIETAMTVEVSQVEATFLTEQSIENSRVDPEHVVVQETFVRKAARDIELDKNYDEEEVL